MKNSRSKQRPLWQYILILLVFLAGGFLLGLGIGKLGRYLKDSGLDFPAALQAVYGVLYYVFPAALAAGLVLLALYAVFSLRSARRLFAGWDGEDEGVIQSAELRVESVVALSNLGFILLLCSFALWAACEKAIYGDGYSPMSIPMLVLLLGGMAVHVVVQRAAVQAEKRLNPEKEGEALDIHFQRDWLKSCDEAQRRMIGQAAYKAFWAANTACLVLWVVCVIGILLLDTGPAPMVMVTVIWLTLFLSYQLEGHRLEYGKKRPQ